MTVSVLHNIMALCLDMSPFINLVIAWNMMPWHLSISLRQLMKSIIVLVSVTRFLVLPGYFYAPDLADESVLAMCSKPSNSILITGDTQGIIKVWDIMDYCVRPQERVSLSLAVCVCGGWMERERLAHCAGIDKFDQSLHWYFEL